LDEAGDAALMQALLGLKARGATVVAMTHRTSLLAVTDKILWLAEGGQQAFGPRDQVLEALRKVNEQAQAQAQQAQQAARAAQTADAGGGAPPTGALPQAGAA